MLTFSSALFFIGVDFLFYQKHSKGWKVSILCQSRLFLLRPAAHSLMGQARKYPSSVNRGYFSCANGSLHCLLATICIHPLSIEAISPASGSLTPILSVRSVSILCQSRLFLLLNAQNPNYLRTVGIHPLSIEAISPAECSCE